MAEFCTYCGSKIEPNATFCTACGSKLGNTEPAKPIQTGSTPNQTVNISSQYLQPQNQSTPISTTHSNSSQPQQFSQERQTTHVGVMPPTRSYFTWLLISIFTLGIGYLFYLYYNFSDMQNLHRASYGDNTPSTEENPLLMVFLYFVFGFVFVFLPVVHYYKYDKLHQHIKYTQYGSGTFMENCPSGGAVIGVTLAIWFGSLILVGLPLLIAPFIIFYFEYKWQKVLNQHIMYHSNFGY